MRDERFDALARTCSRRGALAVAGLLAAGARPAVAGRVFSAGACDTGQLVATSVPAGGTIAQTFASEASGPVSKITLRIQNGKDDTGNFVVQLLGTVGTPLAFPDGQQVLASKTITRKNAPKGDNVVLAAKFKAKHAAQIETGTTYAVAVRKTGSDGVTVRAALGNACANGTGFTAVANGPFTQANVEIDYAVFVGF